MDGGVEWFEVHTDESVMHFSVNPNLEGWGSSDTQLSEETSVLEDVDLFEDGSWVIFHESFESGGDSLARVTCVVLEVKDDNSALSIKEDLFQSTAFLSFYCRWQFFDSSLVNFNHLLFLYDFLFNWLFSLGLFDLGLFDDGLLNDGLLNDGLLNDGFLNDGLFDDGLLDWGLRLLNDWLLDWGLNFWLLFRGLLGKFRFNSLGLFDDDFGHFIDDLRLFDLDFRLFDLDLRLFNDDLRLLDLDLRHRVDLGLRHDNRMVNNNDFHGIAFVVCDFDNSGVLLVFLSEGDFFFVLNNLNGWVVGNDGLCDDLDDFLRGGKFIDFFDLLVRDNLFDCLNDFFHVDFVVGDLDVDNGRDDLFNDGLGLFFAYDFFKDLVKFGLLDDVFTDGFNNCNDILGDVNLDLDFIVVFLFARHLAGGHASLHGGAAARVC